MAIELQADSLTIQELISEAERLEEAGDLAKAFKCWTIILEREIDPFLLCQHGRLATKLERWAEAERSLLSAASINPNLTAPYNYLGLLYRDRGDFDKAANFFKKSLEVEETARTYTFLGAVRLELGMIKAAQEAFRKALSIDSNYEEAYYNLAVTLRYDAPDKAITLFQKALQIDPKYAIAHRELGWTLRQTERYLEAEYHLRRAIELSRADGWAYIYLGNLMWATNNFTAARKAFKASIKIWPDDSLPYWCLAYFEECQGNTVTAERLYHKAIQIDPQDPEANFRFGNYLMEIGDRNKARFYLERAFSFDPENEKVKVALSELDQMRN